MDAVTEAVAYYQELPALTRATAFELALMLLEDVGELRPGQIRRLGDLVPGIVRGATAEPRPRTCRSCVHFDRGARPAASGDGSARPCIAHDSLLAHPDGGVKCEDYEADTDPAPGSGEPACPKHADGQLPGVEIKRNVVSSKGGS